MVYFDRRLVPVILILTFGFFFGCADILGEEIRPDPYGPKLESFNNKIAAASNLAEVESLAGDITTIQKEIETSGQYQDYLALTKVQLLTLEVLNASLAHKHEAALIASSGIDCSQDYDAISSVLRRMNSTKNNAINKIKSYQAKNPESSVNLLLGALDNVDTEGMYLFTELIDEERSYLCPDTITPEKTYVMPLDESEAVRLVVEEVVASEEYFVYSVGEPLNKGTIVSVWDPAGGLTNRTMTSNTWFFMLDADPWASFAHDVKFVYVDVETADYYVTNEIFNPVIDGVDYWPEVEDRTDPAWVVFPESPIFDLNETNASLTNFKKFSDGRLYFFPLAIANVPSGTDCNAIDCCEGVGKDKALIINGNDQDLFHTDTSNMYDFLKSEMGLTAGDITYLTAKAGVPESDGITTLASYKKAIEDLAKDTECCDKVFIYITGHGAKVEYYVFKNKATGKRDIFRRSAALALDPTKWEYTGWVENHHLINMNPKKVKRKPDGSTVTEGSADGGRVWAADMATLLDKIKSCYVTIMYDSCHSGYAGGWLEGRGRTIMTTSDAGSSYAYPKSKTTGKSAGGVWNTLWIMAHNTFKHEADKNNDGKVDHKEAYDYANKYTPEVVKAHTGKNQKGSITEPKPPCDCCHVKCNETTDYLCKVIEGDGKNDPICKKVGDYCGPTITDIGLPPEEELGDGVTVGGEPPINETPEDDETPPPVEAVCGDGNITGSEQCDHGSYNTNKCPEGTYCRDCQCRDLETTVVCGDGKISSPHEDCDGGNVLYNVCPTGQRCHICQCIGEQATCGDGLITPPEECDHGNSYTLQCPSGLTCYSCSCIPPGEVPEEQVHLECVNNACVTVPGPGTDGCSTSADCEEDEIVCGDGDVEGSEECEYDNQCESGSCVNCHCVDGECGNGEIEEGEQCEADSDCGSDELCIGCNCIRFEIEPYCGDGEVNDDEECDPNATPDGCDTPGVCGGLCECVYPPNLNCDEICSVTPGAVSFGGGYNSRNECGAAVEAYYSDTPECTTTCAYYWYYKVSNIAGASSCCCGTKKTFECTNCPCIVPCDPGCPDPETICKANEPSWSAN